MVNIPPVLAVQNLTVAFRQPGNSVRSAPGKVVVDDVSLSIVSGECLALVGESGSGKSVTARALIGLAGAGSRTHSERLDLNGRDLRGVKPSQWRRIRGNEIGLVLQDALSSLDPLRLIGREIDDSLRLHTRLSPAERRAKVQELLVSAGMPDPIQRARQRSGELSGGLRQRALIASAIALNPALLIADEPTTALDVTVQAQILALLARLTESGTALLLISHDLAVVRQVADRVAVMKNGRILEQGATSEVLDAPEHAYTRALIAAVPAGRARGERLSPFESPSRRPLRGLVRERSVPEALGGPVPELVEGSLRATGLVKEFRTPNGGRLRAVDDVSLELQPGRTLGLVGESGSGKTTVARLLLALTPPDAGTVTLRGQPWSGQTGLREHERRGRRTEIGAIYQDPLSSFDPRLSVEKILVDAISAGTTTQSKQYASRVAELLDAVGLARDIRSARPLHLSGGQRQRVAIARALAPSPRIIICDEPVSALDVSVQAQVLDLLDDLQRDRGISYLFISHDLGVVQHMSDSVAVMRAGRILEAGSPDTLFTSPTYEYTQQLIAAAPRL